ncbi:hypothetical protein [Corynebacterium epidermidicanis]|nr:hypothetical protein [Corynebacterium epidermidicanis]
MHNQETATRIVAIAESGGEWRFDPSLRIILARLANGKHSGPKPTDRASRNPQVAATASRRPTVHNEADLRRLTPD